MTGALVAYCDLDKKRRGRGSATLAFPGTLSDNTCWAFLTGSLSTSQEKMLVEPFNTLMADYWEGSP